MARPSTKEAILDAAERVIARQGLASATVEAVVAEAGISKGGFFYHFTSKKEMLLQLIGRYESRFHTLREQIMAELPESPTRLLKATVIASINHPARARNQPSNMIALLDDVELRERIAAIKARTYEEVSRGSRHPERVALAMLVADGLWVSELFGKQTVNEAFRKKIVAELLSIIDVFEA